jgi:hypothetical protein
MTRYTPLWEQAGSYAASVDRRLIASLWPQPALVGCALTAVAGTMQINVAAGQVAVPSQNNTGSTLCVSDATEVVTIGAAPGSGQSRIDLIICRPRATDLDGGQNNDFIFDTVQGVPAASPAVPATPAGTVLLGQVLVPGGSAAVTQANITDLRPVGGLAVPGPLTTAKASARYHGGSFTTSATPSTEQILTNYWVTDFDDLNAMAIAAGVWTCGLAGLYLYSVQLGANPAGALTRRQYKTPVGGARTGVIASTTSVSGATTRYDETPMVYLDRCTVGDKMDWTISTTTPSFVIRGGVETILNIAYLGQP